MAEYVENPEMEYFLNILLKSIKKNPENSPLLKLSKKNPDDISPLLKLSPVGKNLEL